VTAAEVQVGHPDLGKRQASPDGPGTDGFVARGSGVVPERLRPSPERAAAAARLLTDPYVHGSAVAKSAPAQPEPDRPEQTRRHLHVVRAPERTQQQRRRRAQVATVLLVGAGFCVGLCLVYLHVVLAQRQFRLDRLDEQVQTEQTTYQNLRLQVAELGAPANIISVAEGRLGMVQPANITYLPTDSSGLSKIASPNAGGASRPSRGDVVAGPPGDADWPKIKSELAGSP
jgi:cell division protein FtsL